MKRKILFLFGIILGLCLSCSQDLNNPAQGKVNKSGGLSAGGGDILHEYHNPINETEIEGYVIAKTQRNFNRNLFEEKGFKICGHFPLDGTDFVYWYLYKKDSKNILQYAGAVKGVLSVENDYHVQEPLYKKAQQSIQGGIRLSGLLQGDFLNDPVAHGSDYGLSIIQALEAYKEIGYGDKEVVVGILDSGINMKHKDFKDLQGNSIILYAKTSAGNDGETYIGDGQPFNEVPIGENRDKSGHGTHCSGIICAAGNNNAGIAGVAWKNTKLISYQVFGTKTGSGSVWAVYGALADFTKTVRILRKAPASRTNEEKNSLPSYLRNTNFQITQKTIPVNMSLSTSKGTEFALQVITNAVKENILPIVSMGNNGRYCSSYPAAFPGVLAVGCTDGQDKKASFSTSGAWISIAAPGVGIKSCGAKGENDYEILSGTSMSAPFVTGTAAYLLSFDNARDLSPYQIKTLLEKNTDKAGGSGTFSNGLGHGRLNVFKAAQAVKNNSIPAIGSPYTENSVKISIKNKNIVCSGNITILEKETNIPIVSMLIGEYSFAEIKGLIKGKEYSVIASFGKSKERRDFSVDDTDKIIDFNFNEQIIWVSTVKNMFYNGGNDKADTTIKVVKALPNGVPDSEKPILEYNREGLDRAYFFPEPDTAYYVGIAGAVYNGQFKGGNYGLKISYDPLDPETGINLQDGTRADDEEGRKQNDSHETDDADVLARQKGDAWNTEFACNLVSPGKSFSGAVIPDWDWFIIRPFTLPSTTLDRPEKPVLVPQKQALTVEWQPVPNAKYYLAALYHNNKLVKAEAVKAPNTGTTFIKMGEPDKSFTATVQALGDLVHENDSAESLASDPASPLPL